MTRLFQPCVRCGAFHVEHCPKLHRDEAVSRRRFVFLGAAGLAAAAVVPVELFAAATHAVQVPCKTFVLPRRELCARVRITGAQIRASAHAEPGAFWRAALEQERQLIARLADEFNRALVDGRPVRDGDADRPAVGG